MCNIIFDLELENLNFSYQNIDGIDLIDNKNKVVVQVSSTCTKAKIDNSLSKKIYTKYKDYSYKFMSISKNAPSSLKTLLLKIHIVWNLIQNKIYGMLGYSLKNFEPNSF